MAFNPDEYLKSKTSFNPDRHLKEKEPEQKITLPERFLHGTAGLINKTGDVVLESFKKGFPFTSKAIGKVIETIPDAPIGFGIGTPRELMQGKTGKGIATFVSEHPRAIRNIADILTVGSVVAPMVRPAIKMAKGIPEALKSAAYNIETRAINPTPTKFERMKGKGINIGKEALESDLSINLKKAPEQVQSKIDETEDLLQSKLSPIEKKIEIRPLGKNIAEKIQRSIVDPAGSKYSGMEYEALEELGKIKSELWQKTDAGRLTASDANKIKRDFYKQAKSIFDAEARGNPVLPGQKVNAQIKKDIAHELMKGIEKIGGKEIKATNEKLGKLIEIQPSIEHAATMLEKKQLPLGLGLYDLLSSIGLGSGTYGASGSLGKTALAAVAGAAMTKAPRSTVLAKTLYKTGKLLERKQ